MDDVRFFPVTRCYQASGHWNRILRLTLCRFDTFDISSTSGALLSCVIATIRPTSESARPKNRNPGFGRVPRLSHPLTTCPRLPLAGHSNVHAENIYPVAACGSSWLILFQLTSIMTCTTDESPWGMIIFVEHTLTEFSWCDTCGH